MTLGEQVLHLRNTIERYYEARESSNICYWLVEAFLDIPKYEVRQNGQKELTEEQQQRFEEALKRIGNQEPIQYIVGEVEFYELSLKVNEHVLIPRPETEELVDLITKDVAQRIGPVLQLLDIGTGSGCIGLSLKNKLPKATVTAIDASEKALEVAKENAVLNELAITFDQIDFLDSKQREQLGNFDLIVSNPPYITAEEFKALDSHVKDFEPGMALIAQHDDPLIFYRLIAEFGKAHLNAQGGIYLELNSNISGDIANIFTNEGYQVRMDTDMQGKERMLKAWQ